jgi:hypothetical protein
MRTYRPGEVPNDPAKLPDFLRRELASVQRSGNRADPFAELDVLHAAPDKVRAGMVVYADGTNWNPGSGEGIYRRDKANAAWVFLG